MLGWAWLDDAFIPTPLGDIVAAVVGVAFALAGAAFAVTSRAYAPDTEQAMLWAAQRSSLARPDRRALFIAACAFH